MNSLTFEEVGGEASLVHRPVGDKLHPQSVRGGANVFRFVVATETANQWACFKWAVPNLQVVVGTAVVPLDLHKYTVTHTHVFTPTLGVPQSSSVPRLTAEMAHTFYLICFM